LINPTLRDNPPFELVQKKASIGEMTFARHSSTINQVVSKRMKRQQMRWTPHGAHLLVRTPT
jgi:hypothetical protein